MLVLGEQLALTQPEGTLNPALHRELARHFNDAEIPELGLVGGILAGVAKFMFAYDLVEREGLLPFSPGERLIQPVSRKSLAVAPDCLSGGFFWLTNGHPLNLDPESWFQSPTIVPTNH